jgi:hypothetical protein
MATLSAQGITRIIGPVGTVSFHGSTYYPTASAGKLAYLNNIIGVFEDEMVESGNGTAKIWE